MAVEFCLLAESGVLIDQAILLCRSIRHFGGRYASAHITVISPRKERRPFREQIKALGLLGAEYFELDLRSLAPEYGPSFRVLALAWCAERSGPETLVQLDSDTVFLAEPDIQAGVAARPVDATGMCSAGPHDPFEAVWKRMAKLCDVDLDAIPFLVTTIDQRRVRASYNGGLVIGPRKLFPVVNEFLLRILHDGVRPFSSSKRGFQAGAGPVSREGAQFWGTSQAAISLALAAMNIPARILSRDHNAPLHMLNDFSEPLLCPVHLHYHWMFAAKKFGRLLGHKNLCLLHSQKVWLAEAVDRMWSGENRDHRNESRALTYLKRMTL